MQKTDAPHTQDDNRSVVKQTRGKSLESPQRTQIVQLERMAERSGQSRKLTQLAVMVDTSPQARNQRRMMNTIGRDPVAPVQRLIAIGDALSEDVGRFVAVHNIQQRFPGEQIVHLDSADLGSMGNGEILYISAHGSPDSVGGRSASALASLLIARGIKTGTKIDLKACNTAIPGRSFVAQLEAEIRSQSGGAITVLIEGYTGVHVIREDGSSGAKDATINVGALKQEYQDIITKHKPMIDLAKQHIRQALKQQKPLEVIAAEVAKMTHDLFQELYTHNEKVLKPHDQATATSSEDNLRQNLDEYISANLRATDPVWGDDLVLKLVREREHERWSKEAPSYIG